MMQAQRRRQLLNDEHWRGATQVRPERLTWRSKRRQSRPSGKNLARPSPNAQTRAQRHGTRHDSHHPSLHARLTAALRQAGPDRPRDQAPPRTQAQAPRLGSAPVCLSHPARARATIRRFQYVAAVCPGSASHGRPTVDYPSRPFARITCAEQPRTVGWPVWQRYHMIEMRSSPLLSLRLHVNYAR